MARPIYRKLLDKATKEGPGEKFGRGDIESVTVVSLQFVFTAKRASIELKGHLLGSDVESTLKTLDTLTWKSGRIVKIEDWPVGIYDVWAEVTTISDGEVSLYFCGRE